MCGEASRLSSSMQYCGFSVGHRELLAPTRHLALPCRRVGLGAPRSDHRLDLADDLLDDVLRVADDRHVGAANLALFGGVDVDVDHLGLLCERIDLAGDAVVEPGAERDQEIGLLHRGDRRGIAVHAGHPEAQRVVVGERPAGHQRGDDVAVDQLRQFPERFGRTRLEDASTGVDDRALRRHDQPRCLFDHARVALHVGAIAGQ